jgi:hypothetical protein
MRCAINSEAGWSNSYTAGFSNIFAKQASELRVFFYFKMLFFFFESGWCVLSVSYPRRDIKMWGIVQALIVQYDADWYDIAELFKRYNNNKEVKHFNIALVE